MRRPNCCEHGDHPAPDGQRFCSTDCMVCDGLPPLGCAGCAGACGLIGQFEEREVREAVQYAENGGQALHCHRVLTPGAPGCFVRDVNAGKDIGHFDAAVGRGDIQPGTDPESIGGLLCHSAGETERGSVQCTIEAGHERDHEGSIGEPGGEYIQVR